MEQLAELSQIEKTEVLVDQIRSPKKKAFLEGFILGGSERRAEEISKVSRVSHFNWLKKKKDPRYISAFEDAKRLHLQHLEGELVKRALAGKKDPRSHLCLFVRLKRLDPGYRDGPAVQVNQGVQVNVSDAERRERVKAMILKAQEIDGGEESKS